MKAKTTLVVLASVLLILSVVGVGLADSDTANVQASVTVPGAISVASSSFSFPDTRQGRTNTTVVNVTVDSNAAYNLSTAADSLEFSDGTNTFGVGNMSWRNDEGGTWNNYTTSQNLITTGTSPGSTHNVYHQIAIPPDQEAGTYNVGITLTATQT